MIYDDLIHGFLNGVYIIETDGSIHELHSILKWWIFPYQCKIMDYLKQSLKPEQFNAIQTYDGQKP